MFLGLFGGDSALRILARTTTCATSTVTVAEVLSNESTENTICTNTAGEASDDQSNSSDFLSFSSTLVDEDAALSPTVVNTNDVEDFPPFDSGLVPVDIDAVGERDTSLHDIESDTAFDGEALSAELEAEELEAEIDDDELEAILAIPLAASLVETERGRAFAWERLWGERP